MDSLSSVLNHLKKNWVWDEKKNPRLALMNAEEKMMELVGHALKHFVFLNGQCVSAHPYVNLDVATGQFLLRALKLAVILDLGVEELTSAEDGIHSHEVLEPMSEIYIALGHIAEVSENYDHTLTLREHDRALLAAQTTKLVAAALKFGEQSKAKFTEAQCYHLARLATMSSR